MRKKHQESVNYFKILKVFWNFVTDYEIAPNGGVDVARNRYAQAKGNGGKGNGGR